LDRVVIDIPGVVSGERPGDESTRINVGTEGVIASHDGAIGTVQLVDRAAESGVVEDVADQRAVINRFPLRTAKWYGLPIALEIPDFNQLTVPPTESSLVPGLRFPCRQVGVGP